MDGDSYDFPNEDAMRTALDLLLETTVEVRETARQYRRSSRECSPFALREAIGMCTAVLPDKALCHADLRMAEDVDAEISPFTNPGVPLPPSIDAHEQLRWHGGYRTNCRGGQSSPVLRVGSCRDYRDGCR